MKCRLLDSSLQVLTERVWARGQEPVFAICLQVEPLRVTHSALDMCSGRVVEVARVDLIEDPDG